MYTTTLRAAIIRALTIWTPGLQERDDSSFGVNLHDSSIVYGVSSSCYTNNGHSTCSVATATLSSTNTTVGFYSAPSRSISTTIVPRFVAQFPAHKTNSSTPSFTSSNSTTTSSTLVTISPVPIIGPLIPVTTFSTPTTTSLASTTILTTSQRTGTSIVQTTFTDAAKSSLWSTLSSPPIPFNSTTSPIVAHIPHGSSTNSLSTLRPHSKVSVEIPDPQLVSTGISTGQSAATRMQTTLSTITVVPPTLSTGTAVSLTKSAGTGISTSLSTPSVASASPTPTSLIVVPSTLVVLFAIIGAVVASRRKWILGTYKHLARPSQSHRTLTGSSMIHNAPADDLSIRDAETPPPPYSPYQPSWVDQEIVAGSYLTETTPWTAMEVLNEAYPIGDRGRHRST